MKLLHYLEIQNFKRFGDSQRIELDHPAVLIGPNNCGKTTAIQAIALWSQAVRAWRSRTSSDSATANAIELDHLTAVLIDGCGDVLTRCRDWKPTSRS